MNKTELVAAIAEQTELSKKDAEKALKAFTDIVADELKKGEKVQLVGFGTFEVSERAAREGRNPQRRTDDDRSFQSSEIQSRQSTERYDQQLIPVFGIISCRGTFLRQFFSYQQKEK